MPNMSYAIKPLSCDPARIKGMSERLMGKALGAGSGWVLLSWSPRNRKLVNQWASDHCHTLAGGTPILALDMYEHSYHMDFGAKAASYVDTFMEAIRWENADRRFKTLANE
jgi:superoxide dismutase, Fe-Mn family